MKKVFTIIALLGFAVLVKAQVNEGTAVLNKMERPAIIGEFNFPSAVTESVLLEDMKYRGFGKGDESKGFHKYAGILFPYISTEKIDFYFKVNDKSNKEKNVSIVSVIVSKGYDNFVSGATDPAIMDSTKAYLSGLMFKFEQKKLEFDIEEQRDVVAKAEKKYQNLVGDGESLITRLKSIEESIAKNQQEQDAQKALLEKEKQLLDTLKSLLK